MDAGRTTSGEGAGPALSNRLTALADEARTLFGVFNDRSEATFGIYLETAGRLAEARKIAHRGQWTPFLARAGLTGRTARNMLMLHRGGWTGADLANVGGVRAALDVEAWRARAARGDEVPGDTAAGEALRAGPSGFVAWCSERDEAPADVVAGLKAADDAAPGSGNAGEGKWNPARPSSNEWYSPAWVVDPAREVMGGIDLDPASCAEANATIRAGRFFTVAEDGLAQPWQGRVWVNPPYSDRDLIRWVSKLVDSMDSGAVSEAVALLPAYVETKMAQAALARCAAVAFPAKRVQFERPGRPTTNPPAGSMVLYFGPHTGRFRAAYSDRGIVLPGGRAWEAAA